MASSSGAMSLDATTTTQDGQWKWYHYFGFGSAVFAFLVAAGYFSSGRKWHSQIKVEKRRKAQGHRQKAHGMEEMFGDPSMSMDMGGPAPQRRAPPPQEPQGTEQELFAYLQKGEMRKQQGLIEEAIQCYAKARDIAVKSLGEENLFVTLAEQNLAYCFAEMGKLDEAEKIITGALRKFEAAQVPEEHKMEAYSILANIKKEQGKLDEALELTSKLCDLAESTHGADGPEHATMLDLHAKVLTRLLKYDEAISTLVRVKRAYSQAVGKDDPMMIEVSSRLIAARLANGQRDEALADLDTITSALAEDVGITQYKYYLYINYIASCLLDEAEFESAKRLLSELVETWEPIVPTSEVSHEVFAAIQCDLAFALNALGEKEESRAILEKIRTNSLPKYPSSVSRELVVVSATIGKEKGCDLELKFRKRRDKVEFQPILELGTMMEFHIEMGEKEHMEEHIISETDLSSKTFKVSTGPVEGVQAGERYIIRIVVFSDPTKSKQISEFLQVAKCE